MSTMHIEEVDAHFSRLIATSDQAYNHMCKAYMTAIKQDVLDSLKKWLHVHDDDDMNGWGDYYVSGGYEYSMDHGDVVASVLTVTQDVLDCYTALPDISALPASMLRSVLSDGRSKEIAGESREDFVNGIADQFRSDAIQHFLIREVNDTLEDLNKNVHKMLDGINTDAAITLSVLLKDGVSRIIDSVDAHIVADNFATDSKKHKPS